MRQTQKIKKLGERDADEKSIKQYEEERYRRWHLFSFSCNNQFISNFLFSYLLHRYF